MSDVVIRQWGDVWHVQADDGSTTTGSFSDAVMWACGDLGPGEGEVTIRWGLPLEGRSTK
jgi:hypothetical protein